MSRLALLSPVKKVTTQLGYTLDSLGPVETSFGLHKQRHKLS